MEGGGPCVHSFSIKGLDFHKLSKHAACRYFGRGDNKIKKRKRERVKLTFVGFLDNNEKHTRRGRT
jgi:hypothetical protein